MKFNRNGSIAAPRWPTGASVPPWGQGRQSVTQLEPENFYRKPQYAKLQSALDRHNVHTQMMLVGAMVAAGLIVSVAAAMMVVAF